MILRPYQIEAIDALWKFFRENPRGVPLIVAPTGSGKSLILSEICRKVLEAKPHYRIVVVTHRKELIEQNSQELYKLLKIPIGIYSSGLGMRTIRAVTCAGVQSIYKKQIKANLVIIDECHLISSNEDSMYQKLLANFLKENHDCKFIGLTATPFRMDNGSLLHDGTFTDCCYEIEVRSLIEEGYLSTLISHPSKNQIDLSQVSRSGFDYKQSDVENAAHPMVKEHAIEILKSASERKSILIFCSGIKHAKEIAEEMERLGEKAEHVNGEMVAFERDLKIERFKNGQTRILTNCDLLTTGFNSPAVDCIVLLRATRSAGLYVQIVGRGMRRAPDKKDCLVLDFGGNIARHGPIDCIEVKAKTKGEKVEIGKAPVKECPECGAIWSIKKLECSCGYLFPKETTIEKKATIAPILSVAEILDVTSMNKKIHNKVGSPPMLRVDYQCGLRTISEFLCFEHGGYATEKARFKWAKMGGKPAITSEAALLQSIKTPAQIKVIKDGKWYRVLELIGELEENDDFSWEHTA